MAFHTHLSQRVTRRQKVVLNNGGDSPQNPILEGIHFTLKLHKENKNIKLRKAWISIGNQIHKVITSYVTSETNTEITWDLAAEPPFILPADPPQEHVFHITTTAGTHSPIRYHHKGNTTDNLTGLVYKKEELVKPGGTHLKFSMWVTSTPTNQILLDGFNGNDSTQPAIWPVFVDGSEGSVSVVQSRRNFAEPEGVEFDE